LAAANPNSTADTVTCTYTETHNDAGTYPNTASVVVTDDEGSTGTDSDEQSVTVTDVLPTVSVTKAADPLTVPENEGGNVTYTVVVTNTSSEPVTITSIEDDPFGAQAGGCFVEDEEEATTELDPGQSCTLTYQGFVPPGEFGGEEDPHRNTVTVKVIDNEENEASDSAFADVAYSPVANLTVDKVACPVERTVTGGFLTYTITAGNDGNATSADATLVDTIPGGTAVVDDGDGEVFTDEGGVTTVTWELGPIEVGQEIERKIVVRVDAPNGSNLVNTVTLSAEGVDDATATTETPVSNAGAEAMGHAYGADIRLAGSSLLGGELGEVGAAAPPTDAEVSELLGLGLPPILGLNVLRQTADAAVEDFSIGQGTSTITKVNLLGGLIKADVVKAVSTSVAGPLFATSSSLGSTFVNLKINNKTVVNSSPNTTVDVKLLGLTVAKVVLMETTGGSANGVDGFNRTQGSVNMLHVTLLAPLLGFQKGAEIIVGHADSSAVFPSGLPCGVTGPAVFGEAYTAAAQVRLDGAPVVTVQQGDARLAPTGGADFDEVLSVTLPPLLTSVTGRNTTSGGLAPTPHATAKAIVEGARALNDVIKADVIEVSSTSAMSGGDPDTTFTSKFVNLVIGGTLIDPNVPPNTTLAIPAPGGGILLVIINEQVESGDDFNTFGQINALHVFVLKGGLIEVEAIVGHAASGTHVDPPAP
ncbi:MAG TPA: choice-of-anchor P family protein, partial [Acidimicrobiales bacterium]|nr:choice-of-anchor P family protein [Acidimicrobiales bacterium]